MQCREAIIEGLLADVVFLQETWNLKEDTIGLRDYKVFCNNRNCINKKSTKGSGGVAIALKGKLFEDYSVAMLDCEEDCVLTMKLTNTQNIHVPLHASIYHQRIVYTGISQQDYSNT